MVTIIRRGFLGPSRVARWTSSSPTTSWRCGTTPGRCSPSACPPALGAGRLRRPRRRRRRSGRTLVGARLARPRDGRGARRARPRLPGGRHPGRGARPGGRADPVPRHRHPAGADAARRRARRSSSPTIAAGPCTGTLALAEDGRWDLGGATTARPRRAVGWVLDGVKSHVLDGATASTSWPVVARGRRRARRLRRAGRRRARPTPSRVIDPTLPLATVALDGVEVERRAGAGRARRPRRAADAIERALQEATTALALSTVATCRAIFETTLQYAKDREQFGRPIGSFQALKHRLADCYLAVERAGVAGLLRRAHHRRGRRAPRGGHVDGQGGRRRLPAARSSRDGLQLHGGIGFTWEHDLHFLLKRAKTGDLLLGTAATHRAQPRPAPRAGGGRVRLRFDDVGGGVPRRAARVARRQPPVAARRWRPTRPCPPGTRPTWARRWTRTMFDAGWLVPGWPPELGGRNAGPIETLVYIEELAKARVPRTTNVQGLGIVAPSIFDYGTDDQIRDYAMPILRGEATACLGHERARSRQRPRLALDASRARRRPLGDQRPEGVDLGRQLRRLLLPVLPHRPRRAEAQGHLDPARADGHARHHRAAAAGDHPARAPRPQRGVPRRRRACRPSNLVGDAERRAGRWPTARSPTSGGWCG